MDSNKLEVYSKKYTCAKLERTDGVLVVKFNTRGKELIWDFATDEQVGFLFGDIADDAENKAIILTGTGERFIDDEEFGDGTLTPELWGEYIYPYAKRLMMNMVNIPQPIIAAINGPARTHSEIGLLCDIVLSAPDALFQESHLLNGLVPGDGMHVAWTTLLGLSRAKYFMIMGETMTADEAHRLGLVHEIHPKDKLLDRAWEVARYLLSKPPLAVRLTREVLMVELKRRMHEQLPFGLMMEGMAAMSHFPTSWQK